MYKKGGLHFCSYFGRSLSMIEINAIMNPIINTSKWNTHENAHLSDDIDLYLIHRLEN